MPDTREVPDHQYYSFSRHMANLRGCVCRIGESWSEGKVVRKWGDPCPACEEASDRMLILVGLVKKS